MTNSRHFSQGYTLIIENRVGYLYALITGIQGRRSAREDTDHYVSDIAAECKAIGCRLLLIEKNLLDTIWLWDTVSVIDHFAGKGMPEIRIALVDKSGRNFNTSGFGVDIGSDTTVDVHVFDNFMAGEKWLTDSQIQKKTRRGSAS